MICTKIQLYKNSEILLVANQRLNDDESNLKSLSVKVTLSLQSQFFFFSPHSLMSKCPRNPPGFRVARPTTAQISKSTAASPSSTTNSSIRTLSVGSNGRLVGRRKDRSHLASPANIIPTTTNLPEDTNVVPCETDLPDDQPTFDDEPKAKRKKKRNTQVCDSLQTIISLTDGNLFQSLNYKSGSLFEIPLLTRSYAMTDSEIISKSRSVQSAISGLGFLSAKIARVEVVFVVRFVLLRRTEIFLCTGLK